MPTFINGPTRGILEYFVPYVLWIYVDCYCLKESTQTNS